jgi:CDP-paratose 2-epimerase
MPMTSKKNPFRSVLIFGGAGFIGSNWAEWLLRNTDAKVHIFDNLSRAGVRHNLRALEALSGRSRRLQVTVGDIRDAEMVERAMRLATEVYHFAAQVAVTTSVLAPRLDFDINLSGTFNILEAARKSGRPPFLLFTSTNKVYGSASSGEVWREKLRYGCSNQEGTAETQPLDFHSPYGCSKGAADQYVREYGRIYGLNTVVFRMSCIAGPRQFGNEDQGWVAHFLYSALNRKPVTIYGNGLQVRDVLDVADLVRAFEAVRNLESPEQGRVYNVGGGPENAVSLLEAIAMIEELTGRKLETSFDAVRPGDQAVYISNTRKLQMETGWRPQITVSQTLARIHQWWKQNRDLFAPQRITEIPALANPVPVARTA